MESDSAEPIVRLALPKGHMEDSVLRLLADAGIRVQVGQREYRPRLSLPGVDTKVFRAQNIVEMLHLGSRDLGFSGADWVAELGADLAMLLDTGLDPVRVVAASTLELFQAGLSTQKRLVVASEYESLTKAWIQKRGLNAVFVRSYGATEAFPPEDADCIVDNIATGSTLRANGLQVVDVLMESSTRLYANPRAMEDRVRRDWIEGFVLVVRAVLEARRRVMVEVNVSAEQLEAVVAVLPCMRQPTVAPLHGNEGFAVKVAVLREVLPRLIPQIKARGGTDIVVYNLAQIVP